MKLFTCNMMSDRKRHSPFAVIRYALRCAAVAEQAAIGGAS